MQPIQVLIAFLACVGALRSSLRPSLRRSRLFLEKAPYDDVIPFVSEHINYSDQILFLGCKTDFALQLIRNEYGMRKTGFMLIIDSDEKALQQCQLAAQEDPIILDYMNRGKVQFQLVDYPNMSELCKQSFIDSIVDYGGMDSVLNKGSMEDAAKCAQHLQNALRLGNVYVAISKFKNDVFKVPFEQGYGWVQELDGDPGTVNVVSYDRYRINTAI